MLQVELVLAGPDPTQRWDPLAQLPKERKDEYEAREKRNKERQKRRAEQQGAKQRFVAGLDDGGSVPCFVAFPRVFQGFVRHVVLTKAFDNIVLVWIVVSCALMAADR
jgi:hypothetical protein